jgi:hypothetical protein
VKKSQSSKCVNLEGKVPAEGVANNRPRGRSRLAADIEGSILIVQIRANKGVCGGR